jgi:hypothetical protein
MIGFVAPLSKMVADVKAQPTNKEIIEAFATASL